jgi:hypothetical protein
LEFLSNLRTNQQTPKGLKPKITTTTNELPPHLFLRWERAHIHLGEALRDILIDYWQYQIDTINSEIATTASDLEADCTQEELTFINNLIEKASSKKREELKTRRINKSQPRKGGTANSAGTSQ